MDFTFQIDQNLKNLVTHTKMTLLVWAFLGIFVIQGCFAADKPRHKHMLVPERKFEDGFEPQGKNTTIGSKEANKIPTHNADRYEDESGGTGRSFFGFFSATVAKTTPAVGPPVNEFSVCRVVGGDIAKNEGFASIIRDGQDLTAKLVAEPDEIKVVVDNRCGEDCQISLRCVSALRDTHYYTIANSDGFIIRMSVSQNRAAHKIRWVCEVKEFSEGRRIVWDAYGGTAPKTDKLNLYEVRDSGVVRINGKTGKIDSIQKKGEWQKIEGFVPAKSGVKTVSKTEASVSTTETIVSTTETAAAV